MENRRLLILTALMLLLSVPVIYLLYKTSTVKSLPKDVPVTTDTKAPDISTLEASVKQSPTFDNLINLSVAYINHQMPGKSIDYLNQAIALNPKSAVAYNNLAVAYIMLQQYQNGIDACGKALQVDNNFQLAKNNLKWANDEKNQTLAAIKEQEATPVKNRNTAFYVNYGLNYFKIGEYDKSIATWNKIFELDPKNTVAYNNIGTALMMKHEYDEAIVNFNKALKLDATNQLAKNNLAWALGEKNKVRPSVGK